MSDQDHNSSPLSNQVDQQNTKTATAGPRVGRLKGMLKSMFTKKALVGFAKATFNHAKTHKAEMAFSFATSAVIKGSIILCAGSLAASTGGIVLAAMLGGGVSALGKHYIGAHKAAKLGIETPKLTAGQLAKKFALGAGFSLFGASLGALATHGVGHLVGTGCFKGWFTHKDMFITAHQSDAAKGAAAHIAGLDGAAKNIAPSSGPDVAAAPAAPVTPPAPSAPEITTVAPAPVVSSVPTVDTAVTVTPAASVTPLAAIKDYAAHHNVSAKLKDALLRADSKSVHIRAQALDDIAVYAPKDMQPQAYGLLKQAADMGNMKAKVDLAEMKFFGNKSLGIRADEDGAIARMTELAKHSKHASKLLEDWVGNPPTDEVRETLRQAHEAAVSAAPTHVVTPDIVVPKAPAMGDSPADFTPSAPPTAPVEVMTGTISDTTIVTPLPDSQVITSPPISRILPETPSCQIEVNVTDSSNITLTCDALDNTFTEQDVGQTIIIQRPAILQLVR